MKKPLHPALKALRGFAALILCIVLFAATLCTILVADVQIATSKDNLQTIITRTLFGAKPMRPSAVPPLAVKLAAAPQAEEEEAPSAEESSEFIVNWVYNTLKEEYGEEMNVTLETVQDFVDRSTMKEFIAEKGADLISDAMTGENTLTITAEEIQEQLENNVDLIKEVFDYEIKTEDIQRLTEKITQSDYIAKIQSEGVESLLASMGGGAGGSGGSGSSGGLNISSLLTTMRTYTSTAALIGCIGAVVACVALLVVMYLREIHVALRKSGFAILLGSVPVLTPTLVVLFAPAVWTGLLSFNATISKLTQQILLVAAPVSIIAAALGFLLVVASIVLACISKAKAKKLAAAPVAEAAPAAVFPAAPQAVAADIVANEAPVEDIPVEEPPLEDAPLEEIPLEEAVPEDIPAEAALPEELPAEEAPLETPTPVE